MGSILDSATQIDGGKPTGGAPTPAPFNPYATGAGGVTGASIAGDAAAAGYQGGGVGANQGDRGGVGSLGPEALHLAASLPMGLFHFGSNINKDLTHAFNRDPTYTPTVVPQVAASFKRTPGRIIDFAAALAHGDPARSQYGKAYSSGHLLGALTEDLANLSMVGSLAAKPLGIAAEAADASSTATRAAAEQAAKEAEAATAAADAARTASTQAGADPIASARYLQAAKEATAAGSRADTLAQAARMAEEHGGALGHLADALKAAQAAAEKTATMTGKGANAPFLPLELAGKALGGLTGAAARLGEAGAEGGLAHPLQTAGNVARGVQDAAQQAAQWSQNRELAGNLIRSGKYEGDKLVGGIKSYADERAALLANPTEEAAHSLLMGGQAQATIGPYERLHAFNQADHANQYVEHVANSLGVPAEALQHAYDSLDTTNQTPEMVASRGRMADAETLYREKALPILQDIHAKGLDVTSGQPTEGQLAQSQWDIHGRTPNPIGLEKLGEASPEERAAYAADPRNAPARFRVALRAGEQAVRALEQMRAEAEARVPGSGFGFEQLKADAITTLRQANEQGLDPAHVIGGIVNKGESIDHPGQVVPAPSAGAKPGKELPMLRKTGAREEKGGWSQPTTVRDQTILMVKRARQIAANDAARLIQTYLGHTAAEIIPRGAAGMSPAEIESWMNSHGYTAWDPASILAKRATPLIDAETVFVPKEVAGAYRSHFGEFNPANLNLGGRIAVGALDKGTHVFKAGVLYLSPRWILGHTIGHTFLGAAAGIDPINLAVSQSHAYSVLRGGDLSNLSEAEHSILGPEGQAPYSLIRRGQTGADVRPDDFAPGPQPSGFAHGAHDAIFHPIRSSQAATSFSDDINRVAVALAKADKGFGPGEEAAFLADHPDLAHLHGQALVNEWAIRESLHALGDFSNLSRMERDVISRGVLFYPWMKHITKLAFDLAVHDPVRVAWTLHLADLYGPHGLQFPLTQGKWNVGKGWYANLPKLNPFDAPFSYMGATGTASSPLASLNPMLSLAIKMGTGADPATLQPLSRPAGFGPTTAYGSSKWGPLPLSADFQQLLGLSPQLSALAQAYPAARYGHEPVQRYDTGQPVRVGHQDINANSQFGGPIFGPLLNLMGVGATRYNLAAIEARAEAKRRLQAEQRKGYDRVIPGRAP